MAASESRFGSGRAGIRSTQDLQLISGLPPVVREGDRFQALFTVRNGNITGTTVVTVTHDAQFAAGADRVVTLVDGRLAP